MGFTRDLWMHRIDLTHAAGTTFEADAALDGRIIADLVAEWATTHGEPFTLELSGQGGGHHTSGRAARPSRSMRSSSAAFWPNACPARESSDTRCPSCF
jgi:hypothetical protein